tara:strand:- start:36737 stop:37057 length:321 start_codon:yes stop_codon:yes gene_type:complete
MENWEKIEFLEIELRKAILADVVEGLSAEPYVAWSNAERSLYIVVRDTGDDIDDEFESYVTMDSIVDSFIDDYLTYPDGMIDEGDALPFIAELEKAVKRIRSAIRK